MSYKEAQQRIANWRSGKLDLSGLDLENLPPEIWKLTALENLSLNGNPLCKLPPQIGKLTALKYLYLMGTKLSMLPSKIGKLTALRTLDLDHNYLSELPPAIGKLTALKYLYLRYNYLSVLPPKIGELTALKILNIDHNQLDELPPEIGRLTALEKLDLGRNHLSELPPEIGKLKALEELDLRYNQLSALPSEIGDLKELSALSLYFNTLKSPPPAIVSQGIEAIRDYLQGISDSEKRWVSKLLVVGEGGVGKTQLIRSLTGESFQEKSETTHGIAVRPLPFAHPTKTDIDMTLNSWDFGGQEIYHATHQFFLSDRSLFIVVWNARLGWEQGKLYYWLDTIKSLAPSSPIILVASRIEERDPVIPIQKIMEKYPQVTGNFGVSNLQSAEVPERQGIGSLRTEIGRIASELPLMGEKWPKPWLQALGAIVDRKAEKHCTLASLVEEMDQAGVREGDQDTLRRWLHDLGEIVHFEDDKGLSDTVMLDAQWVSEQVSTVLECEDIIHGEGVFRRDHMEKVWPSVEPGIRDRLLLLMQKFDLSYLIPDDIENRSLVVERLSSNPPPSLEEAWRNAGGSDPIHLTMKFDLQRTRPAGIPTWFIARSHRFTTGMHWRYGALLKQEPQGNVALLQTDPGSTVVQLEVKGPSPQSFFAVTRDGLEFTLQRFPGLEVQRKVPCPGHSPDEQCPHEFKLEQAEKALGWKDPILQCPESGEHVPVAHILYGIHSSTIEDQLKPLQTAINQHIRISEQMLANIADLCTLTQREFTLLFNRDQRLSESHCPRVFTLRPIDGSDTDSTSKILSTPWRFRLYCEEPGHWHPQPSASWTIDRPGEWLHAIAPFASKIAETLKHGVLAVTAGLGLYSPEDLMKMKGDISFMLKLIGAFPEVADDKNEQLHRYGRRKPGEVSGADLRALRGLIEHLVGSIETARLGGLRKVLTPENRYFWLCERHAKQYLS